MALIEIIIIIVIVAMVGCVIGGPFFKDSNRAQLFSIGSRHRVTLYGATGTIIKQWHATGNVSNEPRSDGWFFKDSETGKLVEVTGTLVIEQE